MPTLRGMTWNHTRGYLPMVATAQRFTELHPDIEIVWEKRSLKAFEEFPVEKLAADYDLMVIDHPFSGYAAKHGPLLPIDQHLPAAFLADQAANSVGQSHASYNFAGHQWALAIDAATPIAFWREDLISSLGLSVPKTWDDLLTLARVGHVEVPAAPINCLMDFYTLCLANGETPFATRERVVSTDTGRFALDRLRELISLCEPGCWTRNPIASHNLVSSTANTRIAYCAFAYGYSNYARPGYADHVLTFGDVPHLNCKPLHTTLGGTGLALSALRPNREAALAYAQFAASGNTQRTLFTQAGGQPGHRTAWLDADNNRSAGNYFTNTLPTLDRAYVRPRYCGYMEFQEKGGPLLHAALRTQISDTDALAQLDTLYRQTLTHAATLS
ncbi:ABC transporter substrate-binding protein [Nibricoccus aquaticus]|uniref:ABC transporter substrate-binding protein n=1 Tax=Nibricoccus aquaticus TaxID=2576891 RepID=A0A290QG84_9BACT|nr:extracellular solute-binding protein [Nibricoccus aquaticus]ATC63341.1 ABC transporter substrate-binding protein [Nibricoccus aquaticus]